MEQRQRNEWTREDQEHLDRKLSERTRTVRETREAGLRAQGGGAADEEEIRKAAREGGPTVE